MSVVVFGWDAPVIAVHGPASWAESVVALFPHYVLEAVDAPRTLELFPTGGGGRIRIEGREVEATVHEDLLAAVEIEVTRALLSAASGHVHLHASGAVGPRGAVLALGPSGAGKSSLAFQWHRLGLSLLGDDTVLVDSAGRVHGFRRLMKLEESRAREGGVDPEKTLARDPTNEEVWFSPGPDGWADGPLSVAMVARVRFEEGATLQIRELPRAETLNTLMHNLLGSGAWGADALPALTAMAEAAVGVDVVFGDSGVAAGALAAELADR
jgi:hypothetical protein